MVPLENFTVSTPLTLTVVTPVDVVKDAPHHVVIHVIVIGIIVLLVVITQMVTFTLVALVTYALVVTTAHMEPPLTLHVSTMIAVSSYTAVFVHFFK